MFVRQMSKAKKYTVPPRKPSTAEESQAAYLPAKKLVAVADFTYRKFKKITEMVPFTQTEWANMLHLSERTLQRYAKNNSSFEGLYTDRLLLLQEMITLGLETFTSADTFYQWLKKEKTILGHTLTFSSLNSERGIQEIIDQISRIQYGVYT